MGTPKKKHENQVKVIDSLSDQIRNGETSITGIMLESHLFEGRQDVPPQGPEALKYGMSITDACIGWDDTVKCLSKLAEAVKDRNQKNE